MTKVFIAILASTLIVILIWAAFDYLSPKAPPDSFINKAQQVQPINPKLQTDILEELGISRQEVITQ